MRLSSLFFLFRNFLLTSALAIQAASAKSNKHTITQEDMSSTYAQVGGYRLAVYNKSTALLHMDTYYQKYKSRFLYIYNVK